MDKNGSTGSDDEAAGEVEIEAEVDVELGRVSLKIPPLGPNRDTRR